jgi:multiple sugar transport system substrate-binding protein
LAACGDAPVADDPDGPLTLDFRVWSYGVETIQNNIANFEDQHPNVTIQLSDHSWEEYSTVIATAMVGGNPPDVLYSSDHWLQEWAAAGWLVPIDQHCPDLAAQEDEWAPYATQGMTLDGQLYGLPYYADLITFVYNSALAEEAGFDSPPSTLDELRDQALAVKDAGIVEYPVVIPLTRDDPWVIENYYAMVYAEGGEMFDGQEPVFTEPGGPAERVLEWLHDARNEWEILDPASFEVTEADVATTMGDGHQVYSILPKYTLAELNEGIGEEAGNFELALMVGEQNDTTGFVRFYAITNALVERGPAAVEAACDFLRYFGADTDGEYIVVKRWALEFGLGFANLPLYEDPDVAAAIDAWGNVELERQQAEKAHAKQGLTPWWGTWDLYAREQIQEAILGTVSASEALENMATRWEQLLEDHEG